MLARLDQRDSIDHLQVEKRQSSTVATELMLHS